MGGEPKNRAQELSSLPWSYPVDGYPGGGFPPGLVPSDLNAPHKSWMHATKPIPFESFRRELSIATTPVRVGCPGRELRGGCITAPGTSVGVIF